MTSYEIRNGRLSVSGTNVRLPLPVAEAVPFEDGVVVRLDVPSGAEFNRNIFLIDDNGARVWQIAESPHGGERGKPFMKVWLDEKGSLFVGNWIGVDYEVSPKTGEIVVSGFSR